MSYGDYRDKVTRGLVLDVLKVLEEAGIATPDGEPRRHGSALVAVCNLADAVAGPADEDGVSGAALHEEVAELTGMLRSVNDALEDTRKRIGALEAQMAAQAEELTVARLRVTEKITVQGGEDGPSAEILADSDSACLSLASGGSFGCDEGADIIMASCKSAVAVPGRDSHLAYLSLRYDGKSRVDLEATDGGGRVDVKEAS